jgi:hypothetical protein
MRCQQKAADLQIIRMIFCKRGANDNRDPMPRTRYTSTPMHDQFGNGIASPKIFEILTFVGHSFSSRFRHAPYAVTFALATQPDRAEHGRQDHRFS